MDAALRILLLDRYEASHQAIQRVLAASGINAEIRDESDGERALTALGTERFDCVVMNYDVAEVDAVGLVRALRSCATSCPVVVLASRGNEELAVELMKAGAADCILRHSLTPDRLGRSVRYAVTMARADDQRRHLLAREKAAREEAEGANRAKDEFLATLSHELRTPLNAILGWSRLVAGGALDAPALKRAAEIIDRNARLQAQLIEDLLDISRIITGKLKLNVRAIRLSQVLDGAIETVRPAADAKEIAINVDTSDAPLFVFCDAARMQQIVWNLLSNAVKFTPNRGRIDVSATQRDECIVITVSDSGIGIQPEFLPHVFERFRQQDGATTRLHGGLGLGLSIVKHLAELHGGRVTAESRGAGGGATFTVSLPLTTAECEETSKLASPAADVAFESPRLDGLRVLLVDPDPDARALEAMILESAGAEVTTAASTDDAPELVVRVAPQVLVLSVAERDGLLLLGRVRELREKSPRIPAAALLTCSSADERTRALLAGFQTGLPKPVDSGELVAVVAALGNRTTGAPSPTPTR